MRESYEVRWIEVGRRVRRGGWYRVSTGRSPYQWRQVYRVDGVVNEVYAYAMFKMVLQELWW